MARLDRENLPVDHLRLRQPPGLVVLELKLKKLLGGHGRINLSYISRATAIRNGFRCRISVASRGCLNAIPCNELQCHESKNET